ASAYGLSRLPHLLRQSQFPRHAVAADPGDPGARRHRFGGGAEGLRSGVPNLHRAGVISGLQGCLSLLRAARLCIYPADFLLLGREEGRRPSRCSLMRAGRGALMLLAAILPACKVGPNFKPPQEPVPDQYAGVKALPPPPAPQPSTDSAAPSFWW